MTSKRSNQWLMFVKTLFAETDDSLLNIYLQKHTKYQYNIGFSDSPLEYFVLVRNKKMVHFILNNKLHDEVSHEYINSDFELALVNATNADFTEIVECFIPFMTSSHFENFVFKLELVSEVGPLIFSLISLRPCIFSRDQFFGPEERYQISNFGYFSAFKSALHLKIEYFHQNMMTNDCKK